MMEIISLANYIELVCDHAYLDNDYNDGRRERPSRTNEVFKEFMVRAGYLSEKDSKQYEVNEGLDEFIDDNYEYVYGCIFNRKNEAKLNGNNKQKLIFFYRGINDQRYLIAPGIYRGNEPHEENYYFNEIGVRCPDAFKALSNMEKLTYMQHYGCPTRLLDITTNPLVALYFACSGEEQADGKVYVFAVQAEEVLYANSDRIQMLSNLAEFNREEQKKLRLLAYHNIKENKFPQSSNSKYRDPTLEQYYHTIKRHNVAFEREIVPFDMLRPQFVQPNKDNPRILKQDGAFIISGLDKDDTESDMKIRKYLANEILIPREEKRRMLEQLEYIGINQATLFPEVDKVADYLRKR